ncbi:MAG: hypothetical protein HC927_10850, partial [Deltaproteobacteria bacterium]|nr:hypothetical protein [Deltaproteobacteria bacterium]
MGSLAEAVGYFKASNTQAQDRLWCVAVSGDGLTLALGAYQESSAATGIDGDQANNAAVRSGAVYVFVRTDEGWVQQAYVKASNTGAFDWFGRASRSRPTATRSRRGRRRGHARP